MHCRLKYIYKLWRYGLITRERDRYRAHQLSLIITLTQIVMLPCSVKISWRVCGYFRRRFCVSKCVLWPSTHTHISDAAEKENAGCVYMIFLYCVNVRAVWVSISTDGVADESKTHINTLDYLLIRLGVIRGSIKACSKEVRCGTEFYRGKFSTQ